MSQGHMFNEAKKVTVIIEDASGFEYRINFGDGHRTLHVESAINQEYERSYHESLIPRYVHPTRREYNLKINF